MTLSIIAVLIIFFLAGMGVALLSYVIHAAINSMQDGNNVGGRWQPSKAYCECGHETLQDPLSKIYEGGTFTNIICSNCGVQTTWNLDAPAPLFLKSLPPDKK